VEKAEIVLFYSGIRVGIVFIGGGHTEGYLVFPDLEFQEKFGVNPVIGKIRGSGRVGKIAFEIHRPGERGGEIKPGR